MNEVKRSDSKHVVMEYHQITKEDSKRETKELQSQLEIN